MKYSLGLLALLTLLLATLTPALTSDSIFGSTQNKSIDDTSKEKDHLIDRHIRIKPPSELVLTSSNVETREVAVSKDQHSLPPSKTYTDPVTGMEFVFVEGGCYMMGSDAGYDSEKPVHEVCVDDFYIGKYEVTQNEYEKVTGVNPSRFKGSNLPVESVNWHDTQNYINRLKTLTGKSYRLPTEVEWEFAACSGGKNEKWAGTASATSLDDYAWYRNNSSKHTHPVGQKRPNGLGLHDMSGNVWEWCSDWYGSSYYENSPRNNPQGPLSDMSKVKRGGSWGFSEDFVRVASRSGLDPEYRSANFGFRIAMSPTQ
ncbi:MAG: formylglycine-generating enzyme family protein [Desulfuromonas sp.]|nr:MAG: formylglycine-generating enzyme family protein [Desulfuromonas sp.]